MGRITDSTNRVQVDAHLGESQVTRHLTRPSSAESRPTRNKRAAEARRLIAADQLVKNVRVAAKVVDFPEAIPVTDRELEVIETYLGAALDECLRATD